MSAAMPPVVRKIPEPMTLPTTRRMAEPRPMARISPSSETLSAVCCMARDCSTPPVVIPDKILCLMATRLTSFVVVAIVAGTLIAGLIVGAQRDDSDGPVDLIVHNGVVFTGDAGEMPEAIAVRANQILKVGSNREILRLERPQTVKIDARGAAVVPGFNDAHLHLVR